MFLLYGFLFVSYRLHFPGVYHIFAILLLGGCGNYFVKQYKILKSGLKGEKTANSLMAKLPDTYHVFTNLTLSFQGRKNELDLLVVGEKGIFVVEVKNHNGRITGGEDDPFWIQRKVGRKGGEYWKQIRNPVKQVKGEVYNLSRNFKNQGIDVWIQGLVLFTNPGVKVMIKNRSIPVITSAEGLLTFIEGYQSKKVISRQTIQKR